jgi:hypothetical protein
LGKRYVEEVRYPFWYISVEYRRFGGVCQERPDSLSSLPGGLIHGIGIDKIRGLLQTLSLSEVPKGYREKEGSIRGRK